ncbi:unnamed protein product [Paramecium octaurelia]|uniref:Helicase ATP-binding domain-containing protein n=1 Tax=Paramecium octaurelia TaxID=43137 RepID=A0A8S1SQR0_PAROT|nr:unnamed protein product [Paramecium octaurelia]
MNDLKNQIDQVRKRCEIVVETPGRIQDLLERMVLKLDEIQVVVLDEADQMLNFGFQENIEKIMSYFNNDRKIQMLLYNATILNILIKRHETQTSTESKIMLYNVLKINQQLQQVIQFQFMVVVMLERLFFVRQKENAMKLLCILNYRLNHNLLHEDIPLQSVELVELERMEQDMSYIERVERERVAKIKFIKVSAPQHQDITKQAQEIQKLVYKQQQIKQLCDPVEALARALACASGYKDILQNRSNLETFEGYITYVLRLSTPFQACGYTWKFLQNNFSEQICNTLKVSKNQEIRMVLHLIIDVKEEFERFEIEQVTSLPHTVEEQFQSHQNYHQQLTVQVSQTVKKQQEIFIGGLDFKLQKIKLQTNSKIEELSYLISDYQEARMVSLKDLLLDYVDLKKCYQCNKLKWYQIRRKKYSYPYGK